MSIAYLELVTLLSIFSEGEKGIILIINGEFQPTLWARLRKYLSLDFPYAIKNTVFHWQIVL